MEKRSFDCHLGRHLEFLRELQGDLWGLLVCYSRHIPRPILKKSACWKTLYFCFHHFILLIVNFHTFFIGNFYAILNFYE